MIVHLDPHPLSGKTVELDFHPDTPRVFASLKYRVEDYWDRVYGKSWGDSVGNPAALKYALRAGAFGLPVDDEVVYGKIDGIGHLVHCSELGTEQA